MVTETLVCGVYVPGKQYLDAIKAPYTGISKWGALQGPCNAENCGGIGDAVSSSKIGSWCGECVSGYYVADVIEENAKENRIKWGKEVVENATDFNLQIYIIPHDQDEEWGPLGDYFPNLILGKSLSGDRHQAEKVEAMIQEVRDSVGNLKEGHPSWEAISGKIEVFNLRDHCYCCSDSD